MSFDMNVCFWKFVMNVNITLPLTTYESRYLISNGLMIFESSLA